MIHRLSFKDVCFFNLYFKSLIESFIEICRNRVELFEIVFEEDYPLVDCAVCISNVVPAIQRGIIDFRDHRDSL